MKRIVTIALLMLMSLALLTTALYAQADDFPTRFTAGARYAFGTASAIEGQDYTVSATVGSSPLTVYGSAGGGSVTHIVAAYDEESGLTLVLYITPPSSGLVVVTATPVGGGTVLTGSKDYGTAPLTPTTTDLSTTPTSQVYGAVILTATVTPTPSGGTVTFKDNESPLGGSVIFSSGVATLHAEGLLPGVAHSIKAVYSGDASFETSTSSAISLTVDKATLTVTGITAENKFYDGGTSATLNTGAADLHGVISPDVIGLDFAGATGTFSNKDIGTKTVTIAGITFSGTGASNYTFVQPTTTADITRKELTVSGITASNKVYDGNTNAVLNTAGATLTGIVNNENVTLTGGTGAFSDANVGDAKTIVVAGLSLTGTAAGNYQLSAATVTTTANITKADQTITWSTPADIVYGTVLSSTQLNAQVAGVSGGSAPGALTYTPATGALLNAGNGQILSVTAAATTNYKPATASVTINVLPAPTNTGSVLGAGLISSPAGAYPSKPTYTGKGYFGFAAGYVKNNPLPIGLTTFALKSGGLFSSTAFSFLSLKYESLVLSGAKVTLKGEGKVNGSGNYGFLLSAIDGHASHSADKLRIKIWDKNHGNAVFYDSQMGASDDADPTATVTGGVITISKSGGSITAMDMNVQQLMEDAAAAEIPTEYALHNAYPNPFNPSTTIRFDLPEATKVRLVVYDMLGREVAVLADGERPAGQYSVRFDAGNLSSGMYIYRLQTGNYTQTKKLMLMK